MRFTMTHVALGFGAAALALWQYKRVKIGDKVLVSVPSLGLNVDALVTNIAGDQVIVQPIVQGLPNIPASMNISKSQIVKNETPRFA